MPLDHAAFEIKAKKFGIQSHIIVKLYDGTNYYYFSDVNMRLNYPTTPFVYALIKSFSGIQEGFDWATKSWEVANVDIELVNAPYRMNSSGVMVRPSDDLGGVTAYEAIVYLVAGETIATFPNDCLARFVGNVEPGLEYDADTIKLTIIDKSKFLNIKLPKNLISSVWADAPPESLNQKIPIAYGQYSLAGDDDDDFDYTGLGLALAIPVDINPGQKFVIANHVGEEITQLWSAFSGLTHPAIHSLATLDFDDGGYITAVLYTAEWGAGIFDLWAMPEAGAYIDEAGVAQNLANENGRDLDDTTYVEGKDSYDTGDAGYTAHASYWKLKDASWLISHIDDLGAMMFQVKATSQMGTPDEAKIRIQTEINETPGTIVEEDDIGITGSWASSGVVPNLQTQKPNFLRLYVKKDAWASADGVADNQTVIYIYEIRVKFFCVLKDFQKTFAACKGRTYGSWITGRGASYADDFMIEDMSGIIESLLRDEAGLVDADIDMTSFTAAENTNVKGRINLHSGNQMLLFDIIKQLAEQSTFAFFWSAAGKAYLIPLNDFIVPTIVETIPASLICGDDKGLPEIRVIKTKFIANKATIESRYQQEYGNVYRDLTTIENTTKTAGKFGTINIDLRWPNICGTSAAHVANHYIRKADGTAADGDGIWANEHNQVQFATVGFAYAHLQPGDWIQLDATTVDPHILAPGGESWATIKLLITNVRVGIEKTEFTAVELL